MKQRAWLLLLLIFVVGCVKTNTEKAKTPTPVIKTVEKSEPKQEPEQKVELPEDITTATFEQLLHVSVQWEVGDYKEIVHKARAELRRRGESILDKIVKSMPYSGGLPARAYCDYFKSLGDKALAPLTKLLESDNEKLISNAIDIISTNKFTPAIPALKKLANHEKLALSALLVRASLGDKDSLSGLREAYKTASELRKLSIMRSLMALKDPDLAPFFVNECGNGMISIRRLAQNSLVAMKADAIPTVIASLKTSDEFKRRNLLETMGRIGEKECIVLLISELKSTNWKYRFSAARALGFCKKNLTDKDMEIVKRAYEAETDEVCRKELTRLLTEELPWRTTDLEKSKTK